MKRTLALAATALVVLASVSSAQTTVFNPVTCASGTQFNRTAPTIWLYINGQCNDLSQYISANGNGKFSTRTPLLSVLGTTFQLTSSFDSDPFINFGFTSTAGASSMAYAVQYVIPVVPGAYTNATSSGGVSVTSGVGAAGVAVTTPTYTSFISGYGITGVNPSSLGVDLGTTPCTTASAIGSTNTCGYGTASNNFAPTSYDYLEATLTYTQTGINSFASWSGAVTLNASSVGTVVPEPATFALMACGLAVLGTIVSRSRSRHDTIA